MAVPKPSPVPVPNSAARELAAAMAAPAPSSLGATVRLSMEPGSRFFLVHDPRDWERADVVDKDGKGVSMWLPVLTPKYEVPGSMPGMRTRRQHEPIEAASAEAIERWRRAGWAVLDRSAPIASAFLPAGVPEGPYIREIACQSPSTGAVGLTYLEAWNVPLPTAQGARQAFAFDHTAYNRWRAHLVASGVIAAPVDSVIQPIVRRATQKARRSGTIPGLSDRARDEREKAAYADLDAHKNAQVPA